MIYELLTRFATPPSGCDKPFLGLVTWFHYLPKADFGKTGAETTLGTCDINTNFHLLAGNNQASALPLILVAVVDDLLRIAGLVAFGFVLYGAVQFITSQGNPDQAAKARTTIINALIGLAISIVAITVVGFLGSNL